MHDGGVRSVMNKKIWKIKAPPKVRIFFWLTMQNKILTQETLERRGRTVPIGCKLCHTPDMETREHLFWECSYAARFWRGLLGLWELWKERNRRTFSDKTKPESLAMDVHNWVVFG